MAGLLLAPKRTATVRSVTYVECLVLAGDVMEELWKKCPADVLNQLETTARMRMEPGDMLMGGNGQLSAASPVTPIIGIDEMDISDLPNLQPPPPPHLTLHRAEQHIPVVNDQLNVVEPFDPDPYLPADFDSMVRSKSRRGSLAPPLPAVGNGEEKQSPPPQSPSPVNKVKHGTTHPEKSPAKRPKTGAVRIVSRKPSRFNIGQFDDDILNEVFQYLTLPELMRMRAVSSHWSRLLSTSPRLCNELDLRIYNRLVTDRVLIECIAPFVGNRPHTIDISNCFHISDEGFTALASMCGANVKRWKMKSVWDITGQAILEMSNRAKGLEEIDLSNCRKVSDTLLQRVVGWVVPEIHPMFEQQQAGNPTRYIPSPNQLPPGTVIGCPNLRRLTLSYCKHVTDRTMGHLAAHAAKRLEHVDLTRCTTITDQGFQSWSMTRFDKLQSLCLADCTYLTDSAVVFLTNAAKGLRYLDLVYVTPVRAERVMAANSGG